MTRDTVIEYAKDWLTILAEAQKWARLRHDDFGDQERVDVMNACVDLAFLRTKEALSEYVKEREAKFAAHERMLESIEAALQERLIEDEKN